MGIYTFLSLHGCGSGADGIQTETDYNATQPIVPATLAILESFEGEVKENSGSGVFVGQMTVTNIAESGTIAILLSGNGSEDFSIDIDGIITVASGANLDFETMDSYSLVATAIDGTGNNISATTVIIAVTDVTNEPVPSAV